jgi:hypothetical protein
MWGPLSLSAESGSLGPRDFGGVKPKQVLELLLVGRLTFRFADHDEVFEAGDAFYLPPGHIGVQNEPNSEYLQVSPSDQLQEVSAVIMKNMQAMQAG